MKSKVFIMLCVLVVLGLLGCESRNVMDDDNLNKKQLKIDENEYFVLYTSFDQKISSLFTYMNGKVSNKKEIKDVALENIMYFKNKIYFNSRYSGNYYEMGNEGEIESKFVPSKRQITNSFYTKNGLILITNGGLFQKEGKTFYKSGLYGINENLSEKKYTKGFFTDGEYYQDHFYILNFDPSVEKEQLLKINNKGQVLKAIDLGTKPIHSPHSMSVMGNKLYLFSNDGKVLILSNNDKFEIKDLPIKSEIAQVMKKNDKLYILYYSGEVLLYSQKGLIDTYKLSEKKGDYLIFLKAKFSDDSLDILYVYDRKNYKDSHKYDGVIYSYNLENGNIINHLYLPKIDGMRLHDFEFKRKE
jgi:hypothetical protein